MAWSESLDAAILSRIFDKVRSRTMTLNEEGELYDGLPGLLRTIPKPFLRDVGWKAWARRGSRREGRSDSDSLMCWRDFQTKKGIWSGPGAEELEE